MNSWALTIPEMETNRSDSEVDLDEQQPDAAARKIGVYHNFRVHVIDYLPNEQMDVLPLLLRGSNRALPNAVVSHGINLFRAVLQTGLASRVALSSFYEILCTEKCSFCSNFGGKVSIFIWKRCCFECLHSRPETQICCFSWVQRYFNLTRDIETEMRSFRSLPRSLRSLIFCWKIDTLMPVDAS
ncbi:hypothetical protein N7452_006748 [Penicillium brevicompactum]|uniref:Uncharacterized protein n=1 Tax=Penicillium brevicompactum TaxID=5074 RepID=A0A9W9QL97_PENBR|nr:hypothetical protein N7452_006748 [Penicillium brevicompactum]